MSVGTVVPTHHVVLFRIRLFSSDPSAAPLVHTPVYSCTLSRTTGLPIICPGPQHDPFLDLLRLSRNRGVGLLYDGHVVRVREQINRLIALGRFGRKPAAIVPISLSSVSQVLSATRKRKLPVLDVLYLESDNVPATSPSSCSVSSTDSSSDVSVSSAASLKSSSSSSSSTTATSSASTKSPSLLHRLASRKAKKAVRRYLSDYPDMDGGSPVDTVALLSRAELPLPRKLVEQAEHTAGEQQLLYDLRSYSYRSGAELNRLSWTSASSSSTTISSLSSASSASSLNSEEAPRKTVLFQLGADEDNSLFWDESQQDSLPSAAIPVLNRPSLQKQLPRLPAGAIGTMVGPTKAYVLHQQYLQQRQIGHRRHGSNSSLGYERRLALIHEEEEE
ncbi:uncharacterized protein V1516DRAFT_682155 [Lipomyces oligophaga]|uniref:uncharacterized protein n=1 Tax=Lipomyces oligophaga TaxID=45792 RepID=UPI0034CEA7AB